MYNQLSLIPDGTAKRDALRLTKKKAKSLPRVTAYSTAKSVKAVLQLQSIDGKFISSYKLLSNSRTDEILQRKKDHVSHRRKINRWRDIYPLQILAWIFLRSYQ